MIYDFLLGIASGLLTDLLYDFVKGLWKEKFPEFKE